MWLKVAVATLAFGSISTWSAQLLHPPVRRRCLSGWLDGQPADPAGLGTSRYGRNHSAEWTERKSCEHGGKVMAVGHGGQHGLGRGDYDRGSTSG